MTTPDDTSPQRSRHEQLGEGDLHNLTDADYFDALGDFPGAVDAAGQPIAGLFDDVVDARESKRRAAEAAGQ